MTLVPADKTQIDVWEMRLNSTIDGKTSNSKTLHSSIATHPWPLAAMRQCVPSPCLLHRDPPLHHDSPLPVPSRFPKCRHSAGEAMSGFSKACALLSIRLLPSPRVFDASPTSTHEHCRRPSRAPKQPRIPKRPKRRMTIATPDLHPTVLTLLTEEKHDLTNHRREEREVPVL